MNLNDMKEQLEHLKNDNVFKSFQISSEFTEKFADKQYSNFIDDFKSEINKLNLTPEVVFATFDLANIKMIANCVIGFSMNCCKHNEIEAVKNSIETLNSLIRTMSDEFISQLESIPKEEL